VRLFVQGGVLVFIREVEVSARRWGREILGVAPRVGVCVVAVQWPGANGRVLALGLWPGFLFV
jgi:hypothetical protein